MTMDRASAAYGLPRDDAERAALGEILRRTFHFPADRVEAYFQLAGHENLRVARDEESGAVAGGLVIVPMGQFFNGRLVRLAGIAAVGIASHQRGGGVASRMMRAAVAEMQRAGYPLSALYPATQPIYRRVGYEQAGTYFRCALPLSALGPMREREMRLRPITPADEPAVERLYREKARRTNGMLDRGPYVWSRVRQPRAAEPSQGFLVERGPGGPVEGYVYFVQKEAATRPYDLHATDFVALTPDAARRLFAFVADHRSMAGDFVWFGGPTDPALTVLREQSWKIELKDLWMLRVLDIAAALEARGYLPGLDLELHFEIHSDDVLPEINNGRFVLRVRDGRGSVARGTGRGKLRVHINGLAPLYTGHLSALELLATDWLDADSIAIAETAAAIFARGGSSMVDHF